MSEQDEIDLRNAVKIVLKAFDEGVFIRSCNGDEEKAWAMRLIRPLAALGELKEFAESTQEELPQ